jgi:asparagine synthase (glutamine-hydrolysing)
VTPPTAFAGAWSAGPEVRRRLTALGPVLVDEGPLVVVGEATRGTSGSVTAVLAGRVSDVSRLREASGPAPPADPAAMLAHTYARVGDAALATLRGEWAAIVWDAARGTLLIARDPLGGRSVHYASHGGGTVFGEDARDVLAALPATPGPDRRAVSSWVAYGVTPADGTLYAGVARLRNGAALVLEHGPAQTRALWAPPYRPPHPEAARPERLRAAVDAAVARAAPAPERVGVLLSGGLDSAIVAASARALRPDGPVTAYSATFPGDRDADESELIDVLTRRLGLDATRSIVDWGRPLLGGLRYLATWRVPSTSPNTFLWLPLLTRAAEEGVEVMLDGQGGDELFDQRPFYLFADLVARGRPAAAWRLTLRYPGTRPGVARRHRARVLAHFLRRGLTPLAVHRRLERRAARRGPGLLRAADADAALAVLDQWSWLRAEGPRWWAYRRNALVDVPDLLDVAGSLRRTARLAPVRDAHPLMLDQDLVEYALHVPPESSFDPRFDRPLARAGQAERLPDAVRLRPEKSGFSGVVATSLRRGDGDLLPRLLDPSSARAGEFVVRERLDALVRRAGDLRPADAAEVWQLAILECWLRQLEDPSFASELAASCDAAVLEHRIQCIPATST